MRGLARLLSRRTSRSPWDFMRGATRDRDDGPVVLCATSIGGHSVARTIDALVAAGLWTRGANPVLLLCDAALPACEHCSYVSFTDNLAEFEEHGPRRRLCEPCFADGSTAYAPLPVPLRRYRDFVTQEEISGFEQEAAGLAVEEWFSYEQEGLPLGEHVRAAVIRFFGKVDLTTEPRHLVEATTRRYGAAALVAATVARRIIDAVKPEAVVSHHGIYVPQGVLGEVARRAGVRVVNWGPTYRDRTVIYSHGDTYHRTLIDEPADQWDRPLDARREEDLLRFLAERRRGKGDWTWITPEAALRPELQEQHDLVRTLALDPDRPIFGLLTNVLWDAQLYYEGQAFQDMLDWLWLTIDHFAAHPELQLVIRIHPHEVKAGNRQPIADEIDRRYPRLPENVRLVPYDSPLNTYALMLLGRATIIYGTKTGVELTPLGHPVVVAAEAWIRGKGLTLDASTREEYQRILERLTEIEPLDEATTARARRYAYHYFFRRMIPLSSLREGTADVTVGISSADDLLPGRDPGLDVICNGILHGTPFVFDA